jgi:hypothetical protein
MLRLFVLSLVLAATPATSAPAERVVPQHVTRIEMRRVNLHPDDAVAIYVEDLTGTLVAKHAGQPPNLDDKYSYDVAIDSAEITISAATLTLLLNKYVFADPKSPISKVTVAIDGRQIKQKGTLHKGGVGLPFEMDASVTATPDGNVRIRPTKLKVGHLPAKGLLDLFGVQTDDLISGKHMHGVRVDHEDLILDPSQLIPAPGIRGHVTSVRMAKDQLVEVYGTGARPHRADGGRNYIAYRGGSIHFGKLTMADADLKLIDNNLRDSFDFSVDHYKDQLVAGYSKTTPSSGLEVFMPDYYKVKKATGP